MNRTWLRSTVLAVVVVMVAACGGTTTPTATAPASTTHATTVPQSAPAATPTAPAPTQQATQSAAPGTVAPPTEQASTGPEPSVTPAPTPVIVAPQSVAPGVTVVRWYCCLGAGDAPEQVAVETKVINDFNASHSDIQIHGEFVVYAQAYDTLATEIAGGNPPDIVGPVGFGGANAFSGHWLDLTP